MQFLLVLLTQVFAVTCILVAYGISQNLFQEEKKEIEYMNKFFGISLTSYEEQPDGSSEKPACTLYYSDGKQQQKKLDQETAKQLRAYFTELALCLLDEQP